MSRYSERWATLAERIDRQKARMEKLDERIGRLMSERVDVEEKLAELYKLRDRLEAVNTCECQGERANCLCQSVAK